MIFALNIEKDVVTSIGFSDKSSGGRKSILAPRIVHKLWMIWLQKSLRAVCRRLKR
jgi:hypothetical protein